MLWKTIFVHTKDNLGGALKSIMINDNTQSLCRNKKCILMEYEAYCLDTGD